MTSEIDYSRPVGWWCPVCTRITWLAGTTVGMRSCCFVVGPRGIIPVYLPIPEGQRPLVEDEVATGEAEVVTSYSSPSPSAPFTVVRSGNRAETVLEGMDLAATIQRIVTGATE